jgi:hypothetical protein
LNGANVAPQDDNEDHQAHSPLIGGSMITTFIKDSGGNYGTGTLGFFALMNGVSKYNNVVLVSNVHVLGDHGAVKGDKVYQPSWKQTDGNWVPIDGSNPVGVLRDLPAEQNHLYQYPEDPPNTAKLYWVDCATAQLDICVSPICHTNCGVSFSDVLRLLDLGGGKSKITGVGRINTGDEEKFVHIVGSVSGPIDGKIQQVFTTIGNRQNVMEIVSIDAVQPGDSGSAVVDKDGKLVGLLHRATELTTLSHASHIGPVLDTLRVTPVTASNEPDNPAFSGTAAAAAHLAALPHLATPTVNLAGMLRQRLSESESGRVVATLIERHQREVVHLVNHERAVTIAWHRNKGPQFLSDAVANAFDPRHQVPREIDGVSREMLIRSMAKALYAHGSEALRAVRARLEDLVRCVNASDSVHDLVSKLGSTRLA